jgi:hypothetical protein
MPRVRAVGKECGLEAQRTERTLKDLTSHASPEAPVAIRMVCIVDPTWDSPCFVNLIRSTEICSMCSDVLILILSWPFLLKSQALYADEFCRLLGWGLWCRSEDRGARIWSGSRCSPCLVASVLVHRSLFDSLPSLLVTSVFRLVLTLDPTGYHFSSHKVWKPSFLVLTKLRTRHPPENWTSFLC